MSPISAAMSSIRSGRDWLGEKPRHLAGLRILRSAIGIAFLYKVLTEWTVADYLWGPDGIAAAQSPSTGPTASNLIGLGSSLSVENWPHGYLVVLALASIGLIADYAILPSTLMALITSSSLGARLPPITDSGDGVASIALIYLLFTLGRRAARQSGPIRTWIHNLAVVSIILQTITTYFVPGIYKAQGDLWQQGVALYYVCQVGIYSTASMLAPFRYAAIVTLCTYGVLWWELTFPVAIFSRFRLPWIAIGLIFEIGTGYYMGLVRFAVVMIGLLLFLLSDEEYDRMAAWAVARRAAYSTA